MGFVLQLATGLPLRLPLTIAGGVAGLLIPGLANPLLVLAFALLGAVLGWATPVLFRWFNRGYASTERGYEKGLAWVLSHRTLIMGALLAGIALTAVAFNTIAGGFVPVEDQGYAIGIVQAPDGASLETTRRINQQAAAILREEKDIETAAVFSGASLAGNSPNRGLFFFGTRNWSERPNREQTVSAIVQRLNRRLASIEGARIIVIEPPAIPGYGTGGGFEMQLLNRGGGALSDLSLIHI